MLDALDGILGGEGSDSMKSPPLSEDERLRRLEQEVDTLRKVLRGTAALNAALNYERVMDMALDLATGAISGSESGSLVSALLLFDGHDLQLVSQRGFLRPDHNAQLPGRVGMLERAMSTGQLEITAKPSADPELGKLLAMRRCTIAVCIPLVVGLEVYGAMLFGHPNREYVTEEGLEILEAIAQQAVVALQNARLYDQLEQEKERMVEIQEEARNKLARDLHDGPAQSIGAIAMRVNFARRLIKRDGQRASDELFKIEELARRTSKEIRQMLFTLRPLILESEGLRAALKDLSRKFQEMHNQQVHVDIDPQIESAMEVGKQGVVFFIVEEAVNNARKHARAEHIWVRLKPDGEMAVLEIEDNGAGFDVGAVQDNYEQRGSLGMLNLYERAEMVRGIIRIDSAPGQGTHISVRIPMTEQAAEALHRIGG